MEQQQTGQKPSATQFSNQQSFNNAGKRSMTMQNSQERGVTPKRGITPNGVGTFSNNMNRSQQEGFTLIPAVHEDEHEGAANYKKAVVELDETIKDLDVKLNRVLAKQEYEYLKGYNVYVKQKERELKDTINQLSERYNNQGAKDKKLATLQTAIKTIREEQIKMDNSNVVLKEKVKKLKSTNEELTSERDFFQKKAKDVKKKNQLLKLAILRLQNEIETMKKQGEEKRIAEYEQEKSQFFLTELGIGSVKKVQKLVTSPTGATGFLVTTGDDQRTIETTMGDESVRKNLDITLQEVSKTQLMEHSIVSLNNTLSKKGGSLLKSATSANHRRFKSNTSTSRYAHIQTENIKFRSFLSALFASKMTNEDIHQEIQSYVEVLETNYSDTIRDLRAQVDRLQRKLSLQKSEKANTQIERTEFEAIFVECIEDVRKDIMKRRLKNEITARGKKSTAAQEEENSKEFEDSLMKLASFAKGRIKYEDFNSKDKFNILDLFVNNEKTLVKIYEALFPHRATGQQGPNRNNLLGSVASASSTSTADKTIGRYGYHSGIAINNQSTEKINHQLQFATPAVSKLVGLTATPSPQVNHSPPLMNNLGVKQYGSSLHRGKRGGESGQAVTMATSGVQFPRDNSSGAKFNQDSGFQLPSIAHQHYSSGVQSSLR